MSDAQFGVLIALLSSLGAAIIGMGKWAVTQITDVVKDNSKSHREAAEAHKHSAEKFAELSTKVQFAFDASQKVNDKLVEESSGVHHAAPPGDFEQPKRATPPRGYPVGAGIHGLKRASTRGDE